MFLKTCTHCTVVLKQYGVYLILCIFVYAGADRNFQKQLGDWDPLGSPYDTGSVLHYGGYYFSRNNQPTIVDK